MKHILEGGTDGGTMLLFDPDALPYDFDHSVKKDLWQALESATLNGDAYWMDTGADGAYLLHAFIDEPVAPELTEFLRDEIHVPNFNIPSGRLYFAGAEYGFRYDDSYLKKHSHMGSCCEIQSGRYSLSLFRTEYPEELMEDQLRERVTSTAFRLHQSMGWFVMLAVFGVAFGAIAFKYAELLPFLLPVGIALTAIPFVVARLPVYRTTDKIWQEIQQRYPSIVAVLKRT